MIQTARSSRCASRMGFDLQKRAADLVVKLYPGWQAGLGWPLRVMFANGAKDWPENLRGATAARFARAYLKDLRRDRRGAVGFGKLPCRTGDQ